MHTNNLKQIFFLFFSPSLFFSCEQEIEITPLNLIDLPEASEVYRIEEIGHYWNPFIIDSFLIMSAISMDEKIHVYNKNNLQLIKKFGADGLAPFDLPQVHTLNNASISQNCNSILFYDVKVRQFKTINLEKLVLGGTVNDCINSNAMDRNLFLSTELTLLNDHKFAARQMGQFEADGMFFIYDTLKKEKKHIDFVPKKRVEKKYTSMLYDGVINANGLKNSIVYASQRFNHVLFYDLNGNLQKQHVFSALNMPELSKQFPGPVNESIVYAADTYATSEFCFVYRLCESISVTNQSAQLLVFSWDGLLVNAFNLPEYPDMFAFCYDEEFGYLYLIEDSEEIDDPHIIIRKYKIDEYLLTN